RGRSDYYLNTEIYRKILYFFNVIVSHQFGIVYFIVGLIGISFLGMYINLHFVRKVSTLSLSTQFFISLKILLIGICCILPVFVLSIFTQFDPLPNLIISFFLFLLFFASALYFFQLELVRETVHKLKKLKN